MIIKELIAELNKLDPNAEIFNRVGDCLSPNIDLTGIYDVYEINAAHGFFDIVDYDDISLCEYIEKTKDKINIKRKVYIL